MHPSLFSRLNPLLILGGQQQEFQTLVAKPSLSRFLEHVVRLRTPQTPCRLWLIPCPFQIDLLPQQPSSVFHLFYHVSFQQPQQGPQICSFQLSAMSCLGLSKTLKLCSLWQGVNNLQRARQGSKILLAMAGRHNLPRA